MAYSHDESCVVPDSVTVGVCGDAKEATTEEPTDPVLEPMSSIAM